MTKHSIRKIYWLYAGASLAVLAAVATIILAVRLEGIRSTQEDAAASATAGIFAARLEELFGDRPDEGDLATFEAAMGAFVGDGLQAVRLWDADGTLLAATDSAQSQQVFSRSALSAAANGATTGSKASGESGDLLVAYAPVGDGLVLETRSSYEAVADAIASSRAELVFLVAVGTIATFALLQVAYWAVTRDLSFGYDRLRYLYQTGQAVRSTLDLNDVLEQLARDTAIFARAQLAFATLLEEHTGDLILKASYDRVAGTSAQHHRKIEEWFLRRCAATGETVVSVERALRSRALLGYESETPQPVHLLSVAIPGREKAVGVVTVVRGRAEGPYRSHEIHMVEEMAAQSAMAVEQAVLFAKVRAYADEVELSYDSTLKVLMAALDAKDSGTQGHSERVSRLTVTLAKEMGVPRERLVDIERGALLHDVGKIGVPDQVLLKPDALNEREWEAMQKHPLLAGLMVSKVGFLEGALPILLYHHERYDGSGYPFGLQGEAIPLEARIFAVVDSYDAMTSDRPYRDAMTPQAALEEIRRNAGIQFDPQVVEAFERVVARMQPVPSHPLEGEDEHPAEEAA